MYLATVFRLLIIWGPKPPGRQVSMPMTMKQEVCFRDPLHLKKNLCFLDKTSHEWRPFEMDYNEKPALTKTLVTKLALDLKLRLQLLFWKSADDLYTILVFKDMKNVDQFFASNSFDRLITVFRTRFKGTSPKTKYKRDNELWLTLKTKFNALDVMVNFDRIIHTKGSSKTLVRHVIAVQESHFEEMARSNMVTENGYMLYLLSASDPTDTKWNFEITKKMVDDNPTLRSIRTDFTNFLDKYNLKKASQLEALRIKRGGVLAASVQSSTVAAVVENVKQACYLLNVYCKPYAIVRICYKIVCSDCSE